MSGELHLARGFALPLDVVTEASAIVATRGAGKSSASAVIVEEAFALGVQVVVFDRTGVYWGLRSNAKGDGPGLGVYVLGGPHADVPLEQNAGALIADLVVDSGHSFVLDLSDFSKSAAIRFAADFVERLYDRKARARATTLLVVDEAHFYAPQTPRGGFKGDSARLMGAMEDAVGLGRSRGLGVVLTTQRTQSLNKAILDLIETLLVMRMLSPRARDAVQEWIREKHEDDREGVIGTLESLPTGTAWVWSPLRGVLRKVAVRRIRTFDSYLAPTPGQTRVEPTAKRELDLDALGEQMRATVERAKADDPKQLRSRIRELERDRDDLSNKLDKISEPERVEVPVEVEVPVVPDWLVRGLEPVYEALAQIGIASSAGHGLIDELRAKVNEFRESARSVRMSEARERGGLPPAPRRERPGTPIRKVPAHSPDPAAQNGGAGDTSAFRQSITQPSGDAEQRVLDALAWLEVVGISPASRLQIAMVAGYHPRTNAFTNALSVLRDRGDVDFPRAGQVALMQSGAERANWPDAPPSTDALHAMILNQVGGLRAQILRELLHADEPLSRTELAERLNYHPRTNAFTGAIGSLKNLGLVDFPRAGWVTPASVMFLERAGVR